MSRIIISSLRSILLLSLVLASWAITTTTASAARRVALVIGISAYQNVPRLTNPARDAAAIGDVFQKAGFDVVDRRNDLSGAELRREIRDFANKTADADVAVVYYAGHGIEVDGTNYMIPIDAKLASDFDIEDETVSLDRILQSLNPARRLRMVILDACRDNPFATTMKRGSASRSIGRGLAKVEPTSTDTLIAFAAKAGAVAGDGSGENSPFTAALVKHIASPGLDLRLAFGRVRDEVLRNTGNRQEPFVYGSLGGETLSLGPAAPAPAPIHNAPNPGPRRDYEFAAQIGTKEAWNTFLNSQKTGLYADLARAALEKLDVAEQTSAAAVESQRKAEEQARLKAEGFRRQLEEQAARQQEEAKKQLSEQSRRALEQARQQIAEQAKKELDEARRQAAEAQKQAEDARRQVELVRAQAAADAQKQIEAARAEQKAQVAALTPKDEAPRPAVLPMMDQSDIARLLQAHLKRVGCDPGTTEGNWTPGSQKALETFNKSAGTKLDIKLASLDALDAVRSKTSRVCPLVCGKGQKVDGERCVQITCEQGFALGSDGTCRKRPDPAPRPKTVSRDERPAPRSAAPAAGGGGKCFSFNGKRYCE